MDAVLIAGDGIGPEIAESVGKVSEALNTGIHWRKFAAGAGYYEKSGALFEEGMTDAIKETGIALKGPTATPIGTGFRSINVQLRQMFHTYANLRPVHSIPGVKSRYENVDLVIVRENTEDLYKGLEYRVDDNTAHGIKLITRPASERIVRFAFDYASRNGRHKVTAVHKANIMKETDGLFLEAARNVAKEYPDIAFDSVIIDALCMKLVTDPTQFDVLVAPNLYGDIISDLCAGLVGGLGFAPSANIGDATVIYEAVHGSAPDIAGKGIANPTALLMAFEMLLRDHGMEDKADCLKAALEKALADPQAATPDIGGTGTTSVFTDAVIAGILENKR
ncbi:isocitrate/isopropylmalate dehydrogenase family protein [Galactobacillus timonensis]|uniref:isocitrate/isopropylmalate dehydrogenase family protein n=1 Tax=Galactobacillus timonensis TaxID=2041840 RepID=UPI000C83E683|nr:isocitrate/isopropylmalate dehydrogenase family protein [Galactobacillus timonensis]